MHTRNMAPEIISNAVYIFRGFLSPEQCDEVLAHFDDKERYIAETLSYNFNSKDNNSSPDAKVESKSRKGHVKFMNDVYDLPHGEKITMALDHYSSETGIVTYPDHVIFQLGIYDEPGDHFIWHPDHSISISNFNDEVRKVSASLQLTDPSEYEGCNLHLQLPTSIEQSNEGVNTMIASKERGDLIVFPSYLKHKISELKSGTRHALVLWYQGPDWR